MRYISYILWAILIILGVSFAVLNSHTLPLNYLAGKTTIYFPLLFLLLLAIGAVLGMVALLPVIVKSKATILKVKHEKKVLAEELAKLHPIPVQDDH